MSETENQIEIDIYVVTETKYLRLPEMICEECNLFINAAKKAQEESDVPISISVYSWWIHSPWVILKGGYHAPVMFIDNQKFCQVHNVPDKDEILSKIEQPQP